MSSMRRAVERSYASTRLGSEDKRLDEINGVCNPVKRAGLRAVHAAVANFSEIVPQSLQPTLIRLGEGKRSVTYVDNQNTVLKVIKLSSYLGAYMMNTKQERRRLADRLQHEHDIMASCIGSIVAPHEITVEPHPINHEQEAVVIRQPYHPLVYLRLCAAPDDTPSDVWSMIQFAEQRHPGTLTQLRSMVAGGRRMIEDSCLGLVLDVVGRDNIGLEIGPMAMSNALVITDAQPVPKTDGTHGIALRHFENLEAALELAA